MHRTPRWHRGAIQAPRARGSQIRNVRHFPMSESVQIPHKDCRGEFRPAAAKYRRISRLLMLFMLPALGFWLFSLTDKGRQIGMVGFFIVIAIGSIATVKLRKLICPSCCQRADKEAEQLWPECGSLALEKEDNFFVVTRCRSCDMNLMRGKGGRRYKIRYCTICGAHLDDIGV